jgi:hypothetical protein
MPANDSAEGVEQDISPSRAHHVQPQDPIRWTVPLPGTPLKE